MIRKFPPAVLTILVLVAVVPAWCAEPIEPGAYARVNAALAEAHVLPRYARLSAATETFVTATRDFCAAHDQAGRARAQARFHDVMDAWMGVQHLRFGPIERFMRAYRFYFWPQARGKVAEAISAFIATGDPAAHLPSHLSQASVVVQGLLAAETLLFDDRYLGAESKDSAKIGCGLLRSTAVNMHRMADEIVAEWREGELPFNQLLAEPGSHNPHFQDHREVTLILFKSLNDSLQLIADVKLKPVIGGSIQAARPHYAESRLSRRSLRNVIENLKALRALYLGEGGPGLGDLTMTVDPKLDRLLRKAFRLTIATASSIDRPLEKAAADPKLWPKAKKLTTQVQALRQIVRDRLAPALELSVGFNALDGD